MSSNNQSAKEILKKFLEWFRKLFKMKKQSVGSSMAPDADPEGNELPEEYQAEEKFIDRILNDNDKAFLAELASDIDEKIQLAIENDNFAEQYQWEAMRFAIDNFFDAEGKVNQDFNIEEFLDSKSELLQDHIETKFGSDDAQAEIAYNESIPERKEAIEIYSFNKDFAELLKKHEPSTFDDKNLYHDANDVSLRVGLYQLASAVDAASSESYLRNSPEWVRDEKASEISKAHNTEIKEFLSKAHDQEFYKQRGGRASSIKTGYDDTFSM